MSVRSKSSESVRSDGSDVRLDSADATEPAGIATVIDPVDEDRRPSVHTHPLEVVSLAIGTVLLALGLVFAVGDVDISRVSVGWISFGTLGTIGILLVALAVRRHRADGPRDRSVA